MDQTNLLTSPASNNQLATTGGGLTDAPSQEKTMEDVIIAMKTMKSMAQKTEKDLSNLKESMEIYLDAAENKQEKMMKTAISFQGFVVKDYHLGLSKTIEYVEKAINNCATYENTLNGQLSIQFLSDLDRFSTTWKNEKDNTRQQYKLLKTTLRNLRKKSNQHRRTEDYVRELREAKNVQKKIHEALEELKKIMHKFVHSQLLYHSQCFQIWTQVMYNIKTHDNLSVSNKNSEGGVPTRGQSQDRNTPLTREEYSDSEDSDHGPGQPSQQQQQGGVRRTSSSSSSSARASSGNQAAVIQSTSGTSRNTRFRAAANTVRASNRLKQNNSDKVRIP